MCNRTFCSFVDFNKEFEEASLFIDRLNKNEAVHLWAGAVL